MTELPAPNRIPWPPLVYLAAAVAGVLLQRALPLPWPGDGPLRFGLAAIGACLACAGLAIDLQAMRRFRHHRTTILPHRGASALITDGPFAWSRNPIYLGNTLVVFGAGLALGLPWLLTAAPLAAVLVQKLAIEREERHLAARFGKDWRDYAARTPRWLLIKS